MVNQIKVLIVEDSPISAELLSYIINSDPALKVIGIVQNGHQAIEFIKVQVPDVITMDIVMPKMGGFEATRQIMQTHPIPIIIISGAYTKEDVNKSFEAIKVGALEVIEKPKGLGDPNFDTVSKNIRKTIKMVAGAKLITRKEPKQTFKAIKNTLSDKSHNKLIWKEKVKAVGIGASLGGPQALSLILSNLPESFPVPIFIVQHISAGFTAGLIDWLRYYSKLEVRLAKHNEKALPGKVYVAPDHFHLEITPDLTMKLLNEPSEGGLKPSVGRLFRSMAKSFGRNCIGVILTGMGRDGVDDLLYMKQLGAMTIAQSKEDCIMFGMPGEAIAIDAALEVLPLDKIAATLENYALPSRTK